MPHERLELEDAALEELNSGAHLDPEVKQAINERGEEYFEATSARNSTLTEMADRDDQAVDRIAEELEAENDRNYKQLGTML